MAIIDPYSDAAVPVHLRFGDTPLGHATGSYWQYGDEVFLVTNWHVVTGRNPNTMEHIHAHAGEPDTAAITLSDHEGSTKEIIVPLRTDGKPVWYVHPEHGRRVDVVAIRVTVPEGFAPTCINNLRDRALKTLVGSPMFVLGFPFDPFGSPSSHYPIWKAATAASEPSFSPDSSRFMLVDTASRPGMSGAPVIQRAHGLTLVEFGDDGGLARPTEFSFPVTKLIGIYSGRLHTHSSLDAQLGMVWPRVLVDELLAGGRLERF